MAVVEEHIVIPRTPQEVFDYVLEAEHLPAWDTSIIEAHWEGERRAGVGARIRGTSKVLGRRFPWVSEIAECEEPHRAVYRSVEGPVRFTITERMEPEDGGASTRFTWRIDADPGLGGVFGRLADPLVERAQARTVRNNLETLAEILTEHEDVA